ncbi:MAG: Chaperone SurA [Candidatus Omnitrophica bacterium]|nr:Chaperone SurA [Candidatus Omnitrophota bacterium]
MRRATALCLMALCLLAPVSGAEVLERILAVVNDEVITEQDLQIVMAPVAAQFRTQYTGVELEERMGQARRDFLSKLIEEKLILSEAKKMQVIVKDSEVDEMVADVRNKFQDRESFLQALEDQGMSEKKLWERFRDQIMTSKLVGYDVKSKVSVSPGEISEYYRSNQDEFQQGERVRLQQILVRVSTRKPEEARSLAESLVKQISEGASFEELAKTHSEGAEAKEGGEMGWMERGQLLGEIDEKVFALPVGGITNPIETSLGYHIFKVLEKQPASLRSLSDVRSEIQDRLFKQKLKKRLDTYVEDLKKNAYISIR